MDSARHDEREAEPAESLAGRCEPGVSAAIAANGIRLDLYDSSAQATVSAYTSTSQASLVGGWHHLAVTYDGRGGAAAANGITIYVDGVAVALTRSNSAAYVAMENRAIPLQIGRESTNWKQYDGGLDEIRIWELVRTQAQIQAAMSTELTGAEPGLVAYWKINEGLGTAVADGSPSGLAATMFNSPTWTSGGPMTPAAPDVTPPQISNVAVSGITDTGATITFSTNEPTTGWVSYTLTESCPCTDVYSQTPNATSHTVRLTGLAPDTTFRFEAKATDGSGNFQVGSSMTFRTLATPTDTTPPTVSITQPAAGAVAGTVLVQATATDSCRGGRRPVQARWGESRSRGYGCSVLDLLGHPRCVGRSAYGDGCQPGCGWQPRHCICCGDSLK